LPLTGLHSFPHDALPIFGVRELAHGIHGKTDGPSALRDGAVEQALGLRRDQQVADTHGSRGVAVYGDALRVATECGDVLLHPLEDRKSTRLNSVTSLSRM